MKKFILSRLFCVLSVVCIYSMKRAAGAETQCYAGTCSDAEMLYDNATGMFHGCVDGGGLDDQGNQRTCTCYDRHGEVQTYPCACESDADCASASVFGGICNADGTCTPCVSFADMCTNSVHAPDGCNYTSFNYAWTCTEGCKYVNTTYGCHDGGSDRIGTFTCIQQ